MLVVDQMDVMLMQNWEHVQVRLLAFYPLSTASFTLTPPHLTGSSSSWTC